MNQIDVRFEPISRFPAHAYLVTNDRRATLLYLVILSWLLSILLISLIVMPFISLIVSGDWT